MLHSFIERLPMIWLAIVILGCGLAAMAWFYFVVFRAYDAEWDPVKCAIKRGALGSIDLKKAHRRRISLPWLGLPLFLVAAGLYAIQITWNTVAAYLVIAFVWFLTAPVRKMWGLAVARGVYRRQKGREPETTYWQDVTSYYGWGFDLPDKAQSEPWFYGKLQWANRFQTAIYAVVRLLHFWSVAVQAISALLWPITAVMSAFYHMERVDDYDYERPWWRLNRNESRPQRQPASGRVVEGEVVTNTPNRDGATDQPVDGTVARRPKA